LAGWHAQPRGPSVQDSYSRHFQVVELVTDKPSVKLWKILIHDGFFFEIKINIEVGVQLRNKRWTFNYYHVTVSVFRTIRSKIVGCGAMNSLNISICSKKATIR
jgi:hypothetical protein